ncbi:MAG: hypothetical protein HY077_11200 [Elusimicrobia bacterium]|nr:hypothetical protein [Elusimicrobiota bacterium]
MRILALLLCALSFQARAAEKSKAAGHYRCWSFNVGTRAGRCTSPPLVLKEDGTYSMSTEKGTYKVKGSQLVLSASKIRGPGKFNKDGNQIVFEYKYKGVQQSVIYLRQ